MRSIKIKKDTFPTEQQTEFETCGDAMDISNKCYAPKLMSNFLLHEGNFHKNFMNFHKKHC